MRVAPIAAVGLALAVIGSGGGLTATASSRSQSFSHRVAALEARWSADAADGVPQSSLVPLRETLARSPYRAAAAWSPMWWGDDGGTLLADLTARTDRARKAALAAARARAAAPLLEWRQLLAHHITFVSAEEAAGRQSWPAQLAAAATPRALDSLARQWTAAVERARTAALAIEDEAAPFGGANGLVVRAGAAAATAQGNRLDAGPVPSLVTTLSVRLAADAGAPDTIHSLVAALPALEALIKTDSDVSGAVRSMQSVVDRAVALGTPNSQRFRTQATAIVAALRGASTAGGLAAVAADASSLRATVNREIASLPAVVVAAPPAPTCGQGAGGKVVSINLSLQQAVFSENGCEVGRTLVTTGRAGLRTPTGTFHVFRKLSPVHFVSPWPRGSPYYYVPTTANWGLEFAGGGFFLHDAYWEPAGAYGPGSQNGPSATHGCVHIPSGTMAWLFGWAGYGTAVIITY